MIRGFEKNRIEAKTLTFAVRASDRLQKAPTMKVSFVINEADGSRQGSGVTHTRLASTTATNDSSLKTSNSDDEPGFLWFIYD
jgi:hypothetical protein